MAKKYTLLENVIAKICVDYYENCLPKRGKPQANREWTILAGVVQARLPAVAVSVTTNRTPAAATARKVFNEMVYEVVAIGTGSKCLGLDKLSKTGDVIHDGHAEVIARRAFLRYLYDQIKRSILKEESIFNDLNSNGEFQLKPDVAFHFFTSQIPCGDASIFAETDTNGIRTSDDPVTTLENSEKNMGEDSCHKNVPAVEAADHEPVASGEEGIESVVLRTNVGCKRERHTSPVGWESPAKAAKINEQCLCVGGSNRKEPLLSCESPVKATKIDKEHLDGCKRKGQASPVFCASPTDQDQRRKDHRTGAKCVPGDIQDPLDVSGYHTVGVLRLKPGRGSRSLSICCSDKIAKWNVLGCQGALLSHFLAEPIAFKSIVIGKCSFSEDATKRALVKRIDELHSKLRFAVHHDVSVFHSDVEFQHSKEYVEQHHIKSLGKIAPSGAAIIWSAVANCPLEVSVKGVKQGVTAKDVKQRNARCKICKSKLFETFKELVSLIPEESLPCSLKNKELTTYWDYKQACVKYQESWSRFLQHFPTWMRTPVEYSLFS